MGLDKCCGACICIPVKFVKTKHRKHLVRALSWNSDDFTL